jgi:HEAT repeats
MKRSGVFALLLFPGLLGAKLVLAAPPPRIANARFAVASGVDLAAALRAGAARGEPVWVGWTSPVVPGQGSVCCYQQRGAGSGCRLDSQHSGLSINDSGARPGFGTELVVLVRLEGDRVREVRTLDTNCPLDAGGQGLRWLDEVPPAASVKLLAQLATAHGQSRDEVGEQAVAAMALHASAAADEALAALAGARQLVELREDAIFWLGAARGRFGADVLTRLARTEGDDEVLEKVAFGLAQSSATEAGRALGELATSHASAETRGHALFWLAQRADADAGEIVFRAAEEDRSPAVREQAVFALSQLPDGQGVDYLLRLCRSGSRAVKKTAMFWLGQSDDPRAMTELESLLLR